jgi:hypothetical protein
MIKYSRSRQTKTHHSYPARATAVVAALPDPKMLIEIECVAQFEEVVAAIERQLAHQEANLIRGAYTYCCRILAGAPCG